MSGKRLVLITGIPGTGKTTIGNHLQDKFGFTHLDVEHYLTHSLIHDLNRAISQALQSHGSSVITWGFLPVQDLDNIKALMAAGFRIVWFDGNREAALREFNKRGTVEERLFHLQVGNIDKAKVVEVLKPIPINPFDNAGVFRTKDAISNDIFDAIPI
jgi:gluconate kinase